MDTPSWQDYYDVGTYTAQARRPALIIYPGDVSDAIIAAGATMALTLQGYSAGRVAATFLTTASGDDLTTLSHDNGVDRNLGAQAIGQVTVTRPTTTAGAGTIPAGTQMATDPDSTGAFVVVTNDDDVVFSGSDLTQTFDATCTVIDVIGDIAPDTLTRFLNQSQLFDQTLAVTGNTQFAGGAPVEGDDQLKDQTRNFWKTQARGTIDALAYAATLVPGVTRVNVSVDDAGIVTIYVADAQGDSNQAMADAVQAVIDGPPAWKDAADIVNVVGASTYSVSIDVTLLVQVGVDVTSLMTQVRAAIVAAVNKLQPGQILYRAMISTAAINVAPDSILSCQVNLPAADLAPSGSQAITTTTSLISFS